MGDGVLIDGLTNAGWLAPLTMRNKDIAMQTFMLHYVLRKRKEALDQLCRGLDTLGVLSVVRDNPSLMEPYFVTQSTIIRSDDIIGNFAFYQGHAPTDEKASRAYCYLKQAIKKLEGTLCLKKKALHCIAFREALAPWGPPHD